MEGSLNGKSQERVLPARFGLARMLLPKSFAMTADFYSTMTWGRSMTAALRQPVAKPRGLFESRVFLFLISCVKVFTDR